MIVAVSSQGPEFESSAEKRFGRCAYFILVDSDNEEYSALPNPAGDASGGAGVQAARFLADKDVDVVLAGNIGPKAFSALNAAGIKMYTGIMGTVADAVAMYQQGKLKPLSESTVPAHFGMGEAGRKRRR